MNKTKKIICLVGPSGAGKTEIVKTILANDKDNHFARVRTTTTRPTRPGEAKDAYYFLTKEEFEKCMQENVFLETAEYAGEMYGTSKFAIDIIVEDGQVAIVPVDINGAKAYKEFYGDDVVIVFIYRDKRTVIEAIMSRDIPLKEKSKRIMQLDNEYDLITYCDRCVINNGTIEEAAEVVKSFVFI